MKREQFAGQVSGYAHDGEPFVFIIDFEFRKPIVCKLDDAKRMGIFYNIKGNSNFSYSTLQDQIELRHNPINKNTFLSKFKQVINHINNGDSYLLNLTFPTPIDCNLTLKEIFHTAQAPYKLLYENNFVVFSPECFVRTENDVIYTYPMKGTIDATIGDAERTLLDNKKEEWEHNTIVDLMRNDIAMIASEITVEKYRYIERIVTNRGCILQTSSEIKGRLSSNWRDNLGERIVKLLPAGSISGAPKQKTVEIIKENELMPRGYYTGIFGIFDGENLDSAVAIRFIENRDGARYFRSGVGITAQSNAEDEYNELIQKVYIPTIGEYPLCETIRIKDGKIQNPEWHQWRYENSFCTFYGVKPSDGILSENIFIPHEYRKGTCKLRISYNKSSKKYEFEKYEIKNITTLKIVEDNEIDYSLKYTNRDRLQSLYKKRGDCDDILIVKDGLITDSSSSNIVFFDGKKWVTPSSPLLKGTARERLINTGIIKEREITIRDLANFKSFRLINAMRDFEEIKGSDIKNILR